MIKVPDEMDQKSPKMLNKITILPFDINEKCQICTRGNIRQYYCQVESCKDRKVMTQEIIKELIPEPKEEEKSKPNQYGN